MITFPQHLAAHDIHHLGVLFKRIRATRNLSQADIAQALDVTNSTISKFESTGRSRRGQIVERYIRLLQSPYLNNTHIPCPLENDEAALLAHLNVIYQAGIDLVADQLSAYDFELIASPYSPLELKALVQRLRQLRWPAYICDGLGFIHAMNSAMLNLFNIAPGSPALRHWESWHTLAMNLTNPSPVRATFISVDSYLPALIRTFFRTTLLYIFTPQMRRLLRELHELSYLNHLYFSKWWYAASSFNLYFEQNEGATIFRYGDRYLYSSVVGLECHWVNMAGSLSLPYYLGMWEPLGAESQVVFEHLRGLAAPGEVYFAAQFDTTHSNHVNCWP